VPVSPDGATAESPDSDLPQACIGRCVVRNNCADEARDRRRGGWSVQAWIAELSARLSPATVRECHRVFSSVMKAAVRDRTIGHNPCEGVRLPPRRRKDSDGRTITRRTFVRQLLPAIPDRYRAPVAVAGGTGLRWGEVLGLRLDTVDLDAGLVYVSRVVIEVNGKVTSKPYPSRGPVGVQCRYLSSRLDFFGITCVATRPLAPVRSSPMWSADRCVGARGGVVCGGPRSSALDCWAR